MGYQRILTLKEENSASLLQSLTLSRNKIPLTLFSVKLKQFEEVQTVWFLQLAHVSCKRAGKTMLSQILNTTLHRISK